MTIDKAIAADRCRQFRSAASRMNMNKSSYYIKFAIFCCLCSSNMSLAGELYADERIIGMARGKIDLPGYSIFGGRSELDLDIGDGKTTYTVAEIFTKLNISLDHVEYTSPKSESAFPSHSWRLSKSYVLKISTEAMLLPIDIAQLMNEKGYYPHIYYLPLPESHQRLGETMRGTVIEVSKPHIVSSLVIAWVEILVKGEAPGAVTELRVPYVSEDQDLPRIGVACTFKFNIEYQYQYPLDNLTTFVRERINVIDKFVCADAPSASG